MVPFFGVFDDLDGQCVEFGDEVVYAVGVVEPGAIALLLFGGELAGDGRAVALADPAQVRAVQDGWVGLAATVRSAAAGGAPDDAAGQGVVDRGQFGEEFAGTSLVG